MSMLVRRRRTRTRARRETSARSAWCAAALLSVTLVPALMILFVRGRIAPEHRNPVNRFLIWLYRPAIRLALRSLGSR
jgi:Cu/Ag efflux pump CusA